MFFMMGVTNGRKELSSDQLVVCDNCGSYGRYRVFMTYMVLSLFLIPVFKWSRRYYVQMSCCGTVYELDPEVGSRIARGEKIEISKSDLVGCVERGRREKRCPECGYTTTEDFEFCPKCGHTLN